MSSRRGEIGQLATRVMKAAWGEVSAIRPKMHALQFVSALMPKEVAPSVYLRLMRSMGCTVGEGTTLADVPRITGLLKDTAKNLCIGSGCTVGLGCEFEIAETITIGNNVTIGHQSLVLTTTHELGPRHARAGAPVRQPVVIEEGVTIGHRCVILPGVTLGAGAIVEPCSVVTTSVRANTRVSGTPARQVVESKP